jgi:uncharacterized protein (DUF2267 family)
MAPETDQYDLLQEFYIHMGRLWIHELREAFGPEYNVAESRRFFLLSQAPPEKSTEALAFLEQCLRRICSGLPFLPKILGYGKWPVVCLEQDLFYRYLTDYFPPDTEEELALAGGVYLNQGYGHFVLPDDDLGNYSAVFVHELTHAILHILKLPAWLDEAIAMTVESRLAPGSPYAMDHVGPGFYHAMTHSMAQRHREYWNSSNIQAFWAGQTFWAPDDGQELSYHLARFLFRALHQGGTSAPAQISAFIQAARRTDAGEEALREHLDLDLEEILSQLLGDGHWSPNPVAIAKMMAKENDTMD